MFEFTLELECASHHIGELDLGVDATLTGREDFDLNGVYLYIATVSADNKFGERDVLRSDRLQIRVEDGKASRIYWREVPATDLFHAEIMAAVEQRRDEILTHLHNEEVAA
ncbi:hypothetical protein [Roseibium sediminis]|uniref:hypothetical protein n=1 Tax=Roseibium sediminis TaxID=1775174 RepID=UPI00123D4FA3|nr:hypothetical protein [Roseibium sediminis]